MMILSHFSTSWALALLGATLWTAAFSLAQPPLRGFRNLGLLACYIIGIAMAIALPWRTAAVTWAAFALAGGLLYVAYEAWSSRKEQGTDAERESRLTPLLHAVVAWPIMLPEAIEYGLADLGVLPTGPSTPAPPPRGDA